MMFPRLYLAKNLLLEDGVIFVSIGDDEQSNLRKMLDSIFGEENFIATIARQQKSGGAKAKFFTPNLDYIHVYAKNIENAAPFRARLNESQIRNYYKYTFEGGPNDGRVYGEERLYKASLEERPNQRYWIECPDGSFAIPPGDSFPTEIADGSQILPAAGDGVWKWTYARYETEKNAGHIIFKASDRSPLVDKNHEQSKWNIYNILWLDEQQEKGAAPSNIFTKFENRQSAQELEKLGIPFSYAKPTSLIEYLFEIAKLNDKDTVLDFFAGSGTFAHAAFKFEAKADLKLQTISVQLPEPTEDESAERKAGFENLAQIARERLRRAIKADAEEGAGFRAFHLSKSAFIGWDANTEDDEGDLISKLEANSINVGEVADDDLLFELFLKDGFELTTPYTELSLAGCKVYCVADGALLICLERKLTKSIIDSLADLAEEKDAARVVCLDAGFQGNDELKANAVQTFKSRLGHGEDGSMFRTV